MTVAGRTATGSLVGGSRLTELGSDTEIGSLAEADKQTLLTAGTLADCTATESADCKATGSADCMATGLMSVLGKAKEWTSAVTGIVADNCVAGSAFAEPACVDSAAGDYAHSRQS